MRDNQSKNTITSHALLGLFGGLSIWVALLLRASIFVRHEKTATYDVTCGPFVLNTITRHEDAHGISAAINFHAGLFYFFLLCLLLGLLAGVVRKYIAKN